MYYRRNNACQTGTLSDEGNTQTGEPGRCIGGKTDGGGVLHQDGFKTAKLGIQGDQRRTGQVKYGANTVLFQCFAECLSDSDHACHFSKILQKPLKDMCCVCF